MVDMSYCGIFGVSGQSLEKQTFESARHGELVVHKENRTGLPLARSMQPTTVPGSNFPQRRLCFLALFFASDGWAISCFMSEILARWRGTCYPRRLTSGLPQLRIVNFDSPESRGLFLVCHCVMCGQKCISIIRWSKCAMCRENLCVCLAIWLPGFLHHWVALWTLKYNVHHFLHVYPIFDSLNSALGWLPDCQSYPEHLKLGEHGDFQIYVKWIHSLLALLPFLKWS